MSTDATRATMPKTSSNKLHIGEQSLLVYQPKEKNELSRALGISKGISSADSLDPTLPV